MFLKSILASLLLAAHLVSSQDANPIPLRLMSFNIRYAASDRESGERPWDERSPMVINLLKNAGSNSSLPTVIGLQEVLDNQLLDVLSGIGSNWDHIGFGRDDGERKGEYAPILWPTDTLKLIDSQMRWLSETPDKPSKGWDAGSIRVVTVGVFEHISTGRRFIAANTHLDNAGSEARTNSIGVILDTIQAMQAKHGPIGVSLTGDFNSGEGNDAYAALQNSGYMTELRGMVPAAQRSGPDGTYTTFDTTKPSGRIDFIWVGPKAENRWTGDKYAVLSNSEGNVLMSDHRAVQGDLRLA